MRRSLIESYALLVCLGMLACFLVALYCLGYGIIAREASGYTIDRWTYHSHQTNERYWKYASLGDLRPRPSEEVLTAERERSWQAAQQLERRDGTRRVWLSGLGLVVSPVVFSVHWRIARRARREERGTEGDAIGRPLVLAFVIVLGLGCCFSSGLVGGLLVSTLGDYNSRTEEEWRIVAPILGSDPAFAEVEISPRSSGGVSLTGVVSAEADLDRLRARVERALGERRGREAVNGVSVRVATGGPRR